jgi:hypothetical protein
MKLTSGRAAALVIVAIVLGLWSLDLWLFHSWAAGGPPTPRPMWHLIWSYLFLVLGLGCLAVAGWVTWIRRAEVQRWLKSLVDGI